MREIRVRAPGRVNLIGDHTDYNHGFVLPLAIDLECRVSGRATDGVLALRWREENADRLAVATRDALLRRGIDRVGLDAEISSTVPIGRGLSSSTAVTVAIATALCAAAGISLEPLDLAQACREAEVAASGVPIGIMDQVASVAGLAGHALLIDCRSFAVQPVLLPEELQLIVVDSGLERRLATSEYGARRAECERIASSLGLRALRDATDDQVAAYPWARHVVSENARVLAAVDALEHRDFETLGRLMVESHASLRDDYQVSTPEIDALVDALLEAGAVGARLTGAGFGGCVVAIAGTDAVDAVTSAAACQLEEHGRESRIHQIHAVDGAGQIASTESQSARP